MNTQPKLTVSGYRGIWGTTLTEEIAREYAKAYGAYVLSKNHTSIVIARDGRETGPILLEAIADELLSLGLDVTDMGMMATPVIPFVVRAKKFGGAIIVTASHNPIEYNGLKFITDTGSFTTEHEVTEVEAFRGKTVQGLNRTSMRTNGASFFEEYLTAITSRIEIEAIARKHFSVGFDPINSVGSTLTPELLDTLGAHFAGINTDPSGQFAHEPEPLPENLTGLQKLVRDLKCHVGFAQDPDGDRLVICDENGTIPTEETMLALCIKAVLKKKKGDVVINMSTSNMSADIAKEFGVQIFRSKVGEANVVQMMKEKNAVIGGEGGGGVIWPEANMARDSFVGIALILELMAKENKPLSEIIALLPKYVMKKEKITFTGDLPSFYEKLKNEFVGAEINTLDGIRFDFPDNSWIHVRPSNTEPVLRIIGEAKDTVRISEIVQIVKNAF